MNLLPPSELVDSIYVKYPQAFGKLFGHNPRSFWDQIQPDDPKLYWLENTLGPLEGWRDRAIPYILHGDGALY